MDIQTEVNPPIDCETKGYLIDTLQKLIEDITCNKVSNVTWSWSKNTVPVIKEGTEEGQILGYNRDPKVFECKIQYSGETEFVPVDTTTAKEE